MPRPQPGLPAALVLLLGVFALVTAGAIALMTLRDSPARVVPLRVLDADGALLASRAVEVSLAPLEGPEGDWATVTLDASGRGEARFARVSAGAAVLTVDGVLRPGSEEESDGRLSEPALVTLLASGPSSEAVLRLLPWAPLEVLVLDAAGAPVAGARVRAPRADEETGRDGVVRFPALLALAPFTLHVEDPATLARGEAAVDLRASGPHRVEVRLGPAPPHGALLVRFVDEEGRPLPLRVSPTVELITWDPIEEVNGGPAKRDLPVTSYLVPALRPARWNVGADCFEEGRCYAIGQEVDIADGATAVVDLVVPRAQRVAGRVLGGGRPVAGAWVSIDYDDEAPCLPDGRFEGTACNRPAPWRAGAPGWRERSGRIEPGEDPGALEINLEPGASLRVRGRFPDGRPAARAEVVVWRDGAGCSCARDSLDAEGAALVSLEGAGQHVVFVGGALRRVEGRLGAVVESDGPVPFPTPATDPNRDLPAREACPRIAVRVLADGVPTLDAEIAVRHDDPRYEGGREEYERAHGGTAIVALEPGVRAIQAREAGRAPSPWLSLEDVVGVRLVSLGLGPALPPGTPPPVPAPTRRERAAEEEARSRARRERRDVDLRASEDRPSGTASLRGFCADGRLDSELTLEGPSGYMDLDPLAPFAATHLAAGRWTLLSRGRALASFDLREGEARDLGPVAAP